MGENRGAKQKSEFDELYSNHWKAVYGYLLRRVANRDDAADLVGEVFTTAWRKFDELPAAEARLSWLLVTARNLSLNHYRYLQRLSELDAAVVAQQAQLHEPDPHEVVAATDSEREVWRALNRMDDADRELLMLIAWDGLPPRDAAAVLGIAPAVVRVRLHRARKKFERELTAERETAASIDLRHIGTTTRTEYAK